jgi:hypothetical protein
VKEAKRQEVSKKVLRCIKFTASNVNIKLGRLWKEEPSINLKIIR